MIALLLKGDKNGCSTNGAIGTQRYHGQAFDDLSIGRSFRIVTMDNARARANTSGDRDHICSLCLPTHKKQGD